MKMKNSPFFKQAKLMLQTLPYVMREKCFGLKGGTAINFFLCPMPRLSVDIDLAYLPIEQRSESLKNIDASFRQISKTLNSLVHIKASYNAPKHNRVSKLLVSTEGVHIKVEPNEVLRGSVFPCENRELCKEAQDLFELSVTAKTLSIADLYGSKICAALDRQHPRDFFDIKVMFETQGLTDDIRKAFVVYLSGHNRSMLDLLKPNLKYVKDIFNKHFSGMTSSEVNYNDLLTARNKLIKTINNDLTEKERKFLFSVKNGNPKWELMSLSDIEKLPSIQWKIKNIQLMNEKKHALAVKQLKAHLEL